MPEADRKSQDSPAGRAAPGDRRHRSGWLWAWRIVRIPLLIYLGILLVFSGLQTRLIFPSSATQGRPESVLRPGPGTELATLRTASGDRIVVLFAPALLPNGRPDPEAASKPTLIHFYGNGMCLRTAAEDLDHLRQLGLNVLIPEYVGYGMSSGCPSEAACYATADAAYDYLLTRKHVSPQRIILQGWSLGGAVAADLAARRPVAALILLSTFTCLGDVARLHYPFLPIRLLLRHRFDTVSKLDRIRCPILIGHGSGDRLVPIVMADRLATSARGPVSRFVVAGADHNEFFQVGLGEIDAALLRFLKEL
ncbi:MAG: alpha/beta hydrolase [Isosphaeraceae bacterium]|nr:alpha/beta hydrolase [Isosphaeraceae bacterium]